MNVITIFNPALLSYHLLLNNSVHTNYDILMNASLLY